MKIRFTYERDTKNCIRFQEDIEGTQKVGNLYIQKDVLNELGYKRGDSIVINVEVERC